MVQRNVAVLVGSLRKASYNRKMALALEQLAPENLKLSIVEIRDLPLYDEDLEGPATPQAWLAFREAMRRHEAVLFVTPEYNRSVPGGYLAQVASMAETGISSSASPPATSTGIGRLFT